jgi:phosphate starvation-inducible PhoH-like protein
MQIRRFCALGVLFIKPTAVRSFHGSLTGREACIHNNHFLNMVPQCAPLHKSSKEHLFRGITSLSMRKKKEDSFDDALSRVKNNRKPNYLPKSENQQKYVDALNQQNISLIFSVGPAGTGKTLFACMYAIQELKKKNIEKIVLTRPVVTVDEDIGFLPGDINRKMDPWTRPIFDIFLEVFSQRELDMMIHNNVIEICPLAFMRGRTFKKTFILSDEMQNSSPNQMMMIATRVGQGSKMVITGDLNQSDRPGENGLKHFLDKIGMFERRGGELDGLAVCILENGDIERSPIVAKVLDIWSGSPTTHLNQGLRIEPNGKNNCLCTKPRENDAAMIPIQHITANDIIL